MPEPNFQIKICGITNAPDAIAAIEAGADAIGLNFYARSLRRVETEIVPTILSTIKSLEKACVCVGVFVNSSPAEVEKTAAEYNLDLIQLHGDEGIEIAKILGPRRVIRAIRIRENRFDRAFSEIRDWHDEGVRQFILDYGNSSQFGGTGSVLDWTATGKLIERCRQAIPDARLILAGGLTPQNVSMAIAATGADGVDTASGVEENPRKKDALLINHFVQSAAQAFKSRGVRIP